jgi:MOSC domain-containing protein YiiM
MAGNAESGSLQLAWMGLRPSRRGTIETPGSVMAVPGRGLHGDHAMRGRNPDRQLTLMTAADLEMLASALGRQIDPIELRRNLLLVGAHPALRKGDRYRLGDVLLQVTGPCEPCSRMKEVLGNEGFLAMRGHGGVTARILRGGLLRLGDDFSPAQMDLFD